MPPFRMVRPRRAWTPPKPKPPVYRGPKLLPGPPRGKRGRAASAAATPSFNPLTDFSTDPVHGVWASDPLWVPPTDGGAVSSWRNGGSAYTSGAYIGADGMVCPGTTAVVRTDCATIPDVAAMRPTGDMELVVYATATDWTPAAADVLALNGLNGTTATTNWYLYLNTNGTLSFSRPTGGTGRLYTSSAATGVTNGTAKYIRVLFDQDNGAAASSVTFWLSDDGTTWTQLGTAVTNANTGAGNSNTTGITIGNTADNVAAALAGTIHRVQVWDGLTRAAAAALDADFSAATEGISAFTESSSNAAKVSVVSTQNPVQATGAKQQTYRASTAAFNNQPTVQGDGTDDWIGADTATYTQPYWFVLIAARGKAVSGNEALIDNLAGNTVAAIWTTGSTWRLSTGTDLTGSAPDTATHLIVGKASGASSSLVVDGASVASGNAGTGTITGITLFGPRAGDVGYFSPGHIAYAALFTTDPTALPEWTAFKAWCLSFYGITVA